MSRVTRAVVLAGGLGTRMRADSGTSLDAGQASVAATGLKAMIPFGRPFLDYALHNLADAGITDICIVIGPAHDVVREYYEGVSLRRVKISFAIQQAPRGTADAVAAAADFVGSEPFLAVNGDNVYPVAACRALCEYGQPALAGFSRAALLRDGLIEEARLARFAIVVERDGWLEHIIEKPRPEDLAGIWADARISMNCWMLAPSILEAIGRIPLSPRGELELPSAVQDLVNRGDRVRVLPVDEGVVDLSHRGDVTQIGARLRELEVSL
jgi:glucose-1-phosphate thymidylyltransferase